MESQWVCSYLVYMCRFGSMSTPSPIQWWRDLFRCRTDLLNFSMGFNIVAPYMEFLHLNWYIAEWIVIPMSAGTHSLNINPFPTKCSIWASNACLCNTSFFFMLLTAAYSLSLLFWLKESQSWCKMNLLEVSQFDRIISWRPLHFSSWTCLSVQVHEVRECSFLEIFVISN